jgi:outer membrane receptor protein involved in Fe transport
MKRVVFRVGATIVAAWSCCVFAQTADSQTSAADPPATAAAAAGNVTTTRLQEVVVTAEYRREDAQHVGAAIAVLQGPDLADQGRISVQQMLEDLPDVAYGMLQPGQVPDNPTNNLQIRGVQNTQQTGGVAGPAVVATYVDGIYEGIGGDFDLNRVEVLYGPQGTLYGRSATAGVVAFHTNDPVLGKFGTDLYAEYGSDDLRNGTAVANLPMGDDLALRVAVHEDDRHGYWWNEAGGTIKTDEERAKLLYQPLKSLRIELSATAELIQAYAGGPEQVLSSPNTIDYAASGTAVNPVAGNQYAQYAANISYDFGPATLTYVGGVRTYHQNGFQGIVGPPFMPIFNYGTAKPDQSDMQELRLASNPGGRLTWLVGTNFYSNIYRFTQTSIVQSATQCGPCGIPDTTPGVAGGEIFSNGFDGFVHDYAVFTEETYALRDDLRLTGGLRYDRSDVQQQSFYFFNVNLDPYGQSVGTCSNLQAVSGTPIPCVFSSFTGKRSFENATYKARLEYDLTPANMLYAMVSTGYLPGDFQLSPQPQADGSVNFLPLSYDQERLTAYELGSKNRLLDNRLQVNADVFYYDYQGWQEAAQLGQTASGAPIYQTVSVPLHLYGAELSAKWLLTPADRLTLSAAVLEDKIASWPDLPGTSTSEQEYIAIRKLPNAAPLSGMLSYDHVFGLGNGSTLVPRAEVRYLGGENLVELTAAQLPKYYGYDYQPAYAVWDAGATWTSPNGTYALTVYGRNLANKEAKTYLNLNQGTFSVFPLEPRVYGVSARVSF